MSSEIELDLATLHIDTNIRHTITQPNVKISSNSIDKLLEKSCTCTLREILFSSELKTLDITSYSIETQIQILTQLAFERLDSTCFTDHNAFGTICIKCFLNPDREICISRLNVAQEDVSRCKSEISHIPVDLRLQLACLVTDHQYIKELVEKDPTIKLKETMILFCGISDGNIVELLVKSKKVNAKDARGRSPLFYALTSSLNSAKKLLDNGARVTMKDKCSVSILTFFVEHVLNKRLPSHIDKDEGITLLSTKGIQRAQIVKEIINLTFCKFIQVLGSMCLTSNSRACNLEPGMLCETLKWILGEKETNDKQNTLINQLQSLQGSITAPHPNFIKCDVVRQILKTLLDLGAKASSRDSEGNTCLHYASRLLFYGVPKEAVVDLCKELIELNAKCDAKNHKKETPLLFFLSSKDLIANEPKKLPGSLQDICKFLVQSGSELRNTTYKEESAFHLIFKVFQQALLLPDEAQRNHIFPEIFQVLEMFTTETNQRKVAVNKRDIHFNSPLHLWASLAMTSFSQYSAKVCDDQSFVQVLKRILDLLKHCEVKLHDRNLNEETPLHVCRTWSAVKLLLDTGANPNVIDSSGNTPLLAAAKNSTCLKENSDRLYPDVSDDPKEFWKSVLDKKLDPWTVDKCGESILSILIEKGAERLAKALVEIACEHDFVQSDTNGIPLLNAICKDKYPDKHWKVDLLETLLKSRRSLVRRQLNNKDTALHISCRNILQLCESPVQNSVHWKIVEHLLLCGADVEAAGETSESCLQIAKTCPALKDFLLAPVDYQRLPLAIENWKPVSEKHKQHLSMVARKVECKQVETIYFYHKYLDKNNSSSGFVFAGIDAEDGRELAIKRIDKSRGRSLESDVLCKPRCEQIVGYLFRREDTNFRYIAFELMEGTLEDLDMASCKEKINDLCKQVVLGLQFLHIQGIGHGSIHSRNVFYQSKPNLCLKIGNTKTTCRKSWVASEVSNIPLSTIASSSDMFSCGLVTHYLLSGKKHPFAPVITKTRDKILHETELNVLNNNIVKLDDSLSPEATHLVQQLLHKNASERPSAANALVHPLFWSNAIKKRFLHVVANEPDVATDKSAPTPFRNDLEKHFNTIVTPPAKQWNDSTLYKQVNDTYNGMKMKKTYNYGSVAGLIRFIRNAYEHINEQPTHIQVMWQKDFMLVDYFPHLVIEVYKTVTLHKLHNSRDKIKEFFIGLNC